MKRFVLAFALTLGAQVVVAAPALAQGDTAAAKPRKPKSGGANLITQEEIEFAKVSTGLEAIQRLRPSMLRVRMGASTDRGEGVEIWVYLDGVKIGNPDALSTVDAVRIKEIRYINATDATQKFGTGYTAGAILVTSRLGK